MDEYTHDFNYRTVTPYKQVDLRFALRRDWKIKFASQSYNYSYTFRDFCFLKMANIIYFNDKLLLYSIDWNPLKEIETTGQNLQLFFAGI